jgi:hypothetical protein
MGVCRPLPNMGAGPAALLFHVRYDISQTLTASSLFEQVDVHENEKWAEPIELDVGILLPNDFRRTAHPKLLREFTARLDFVNFLVTNFSNAVYFENFDLSSRGGDILIAVKPFVF